MIIIADSNIFMSALISPMGRKATILAERKKIQYSFNKGKLPLKGEWQFAPTESLTPKKHEIA